jgi:hypothetical protein
VHEATADPRTDRHEKHAAPPLPGSKMCLGQGGHIAVVAKHGVNAQVLVTPAGQVKVLPPLDLMALDHASLLGVDRAAEPDADTRHAAGLHEWPTQVTNLPQDPGGTMLRFDVRAGQLAQLGVLAIADTQLQFRTTNLDAQIHPTPFPRTTRRFMLPCIVRLD